MSTYPLAGRTALITGAESGIGLATARLFVAAGARVHLVGLVAGALDRAAADLGAGATVADVTDPDAVRAAVNAAVDDLGPLDVLFSNAGISGPIAPLVDYPVEDFARVLAVHVLGAFHVLRYGLPAMRDGGSVIINSSVVGLTADPGIAGYATAKHAQVGLMRVAAKECAARRIRVNTIHPGPTDTAFQRAIEQEATGADADTAAAAFDRMIPLARHASVDEIARTVLFLASDDSSFITGATIAVDGGMSA
ncbi:SDR family NAD(P)-dependent oxidoreductase [Amorphoplanes digitatis]|uniref:NAD(P)-dependent dehydrogenase (Short-subunit alcohol dehydrogenase family) n=1 Tax=Actinoplanes digitatis TaxID=1868 RepID=A0A7W7HZX5_9ACTN|nr:SDR family NAD(P)-dependent oxidoreductase [Actinoplanes digitatis]MBB4763788.1 NAD(P)-dependent dehydrogenase (short-subunit alcohol dehydrogenase family) [Actinoplanes digitatis]GID95732.1 oxidoreductase [Actinoplanes digitatis]